MHPVSRRLFSGSLRFPHYWGLGGLLVLLAAPCARAATLNVPSAQYPTIQAGINAAVNGDTVLIADGTYTGTGNRDLDFGGKAITVTSEHGAVSTIIDCQGTNSDTHRGFVFHSGETNAAVLSGLTIKNGNPPGEYARGAVGGGVEVINNSSPTITRCVFTANVGSGLYQEQSNTVVTNCTFLANLQYHPPYGGTGNGMQVRGFANIANCAFINNPNEGLYIQEDELHGDYTSPEVVTNCTFTGNHFAGLGVYLANPTLTNCTFTANQEGVSVYFGSVTLTNCISYGDMGTEIDATTSNEATATVNYCDVQGGDTFNGNINADPIFIHAPDDLRLHPASPCLGAGTASGAPATDKDGTVRPNPPSIGAYEEATAPRPARFDFNRDGLPDLLWHNTQTGQALAWNMTDTQVNSYNAPFATVKDTDWIPAAVTDLYSDGYADLLWENTRTGQVLFWYMGGPTGTHVFTYGSPFAAMPDTHWRVASMADFNGDGNPDILWENSATGQLLIWYMNGASVQTYGQPFAAVTTWQVAGTADFNGDGQPDLLWRNANTGQMLVWDMGGPNGTQVLSYGSVFATVANGDWHIVGTGDTNGDGHPDIVWQNSSTGQILRWLMGGTNGTQVLQYGAPFATVTDTHWQIVGVH